jgi:hypothetical protein
LGYTTISVFLVGEERIREVLGHVVDCTIFVVVVELL